MAHVPVLVQYPVISDGLPVSYAFGVFYGMPVSGAPLLGVWIFTFWSCISIKPSMITIIDWCQFQCLSYGVKYQYRYQKLSTVSCLFRTHASTICLGKCPKLIVDAPQVSQAFGHVESSRLVPR